jgi:hypothetical protein
MRTSVTPTTKRHVGRQLLLPAAFIERRIYVIRGQRVMLDSDLAALYEVETKALNRAVKRNPDRFPKDFMFQLTEEESNSLRCQIGTSNETRGGRRYSPHVFTEHGVGMLCSVLNSQRAVKMNIAIIHAFIKLREMLASHKDLARQFERLEHTQQEHAAVLSIVVKDIQDLKTTVIEKFKALTTPRRKPRIGFITDQR